MVHDSNLKNHRLNFPALLGAVLGSLFIFLLLKAILHQVFPEVSSVELTVFFIVLHTIFSIIIFFGASSIGYATVFFGALFFRLSILFVDRLTEIQIPFLERGGDASSYFRSAAIVASDLSQAGETYGGSYAVILGYIFHLVGPDRMLGQYLNVVLGISTLVILARCLELVCDDQFVRLFILSLASFMPLFAINSAVLLRESIIVFLISFALFAFLKGILKSNFTWTLLSLAFVLGASAFHSGSIGVLVGFAVVSAFTYCDGPNLKFGLKRVAPVLLLGLSTLGIAIRFPELFLGKFSSLESAEDLLSKGQSKLGGSAYLTDLEINSWPSFFIYAPIRAFYFISSPLPWNWRGIGDLLTFGVDSIVYIAPIVLIPFVRFKDPNKKYLFVSLLIVLIITTFIFGTGVSNTGTAIRHRAKILAIVLILIAISVESFRSRLKTSDVYSGRTHRRVNSFRK